MITVRFHRLATEEYRAVHNSYSSRNAKVGERFVTAVDTAVRRIIADPTSHAIEIREIRRVRVSRFPYQLFFELLRDDLAQIVAVAHTSRRPRYWRRRK